MNEQQVFDALRALSAKIQDNYNQAYREWLKHLVTLSTGALALLVSLRSSYAPPNAQAGWLLSVCWCSLCAATLLGLWALYGEAQWHQEFSDQIRTVGRKHLAQSGHNDLIAAIGSMRYERPRRFRYAAAASAVSLALAVTALAAFAVLNAPS